MSTTFETFQEAANEKIMTTLDKMFEQLYTLAAKNLSKYDLSKKRKFTQTDLKKMMRGEYEEEEDEESVDDQPKFPKGLTPNKWKKLVSLRDSRKPDQFVNVKTGTLVKKTARNKTAYAWKGPFCAPLISKALVMWAFKNQPAEEEEPEDEFEELDEDEDVGEEEGEEDVEEEVYSVKKIKRLRIAAKKALDKGSYVNADTMRPCKKTDASKKKFCFYKQGFAIPRNNKEMMEAIFEKW